jgi:colanic acid biosynthesis glycosyl transferase WcaI
VVELARAPLLAPAPEPLPEPRRILVWSPNYAPELTGIPPLVTDACEWLAARGHGVDVVTALPNYPSRVIPRDYRGAPWRTERLGGVTVHRSWLRVRPEERFVDKVLYELTFAACSLPRTLRRLASADVVVCVVPSLVAAVAATRAVRLLPRARRPRMVLWVQDLVLDGALAVDGVGNAQRRLLRLVAHAERSALLAADRVVVCSPGFRDRFVARGVPRRRIGVLHNWVDVEAIAPAPRLPHPRWTRFLYSGNLGYSQGFETLIDAADRAGSAIELDIVGDGNAARHVRELAGSVDNVTVAPPVPRAHLPGLLASADVQVVVQRRVSAGANLPSKIATYLASGRPVLASIDASTPAAQLLRASGGALLVEPDSADALARGMLELHRLPDLRGELARRGREYAVEQLAKEPALRRLEQELLG